MSDACWFEIEFRREDLPRFNEVLKEHLYEGEWWDQDDSEAPDSVLMQLSRHQANYGWTDEIKTLADARMSFTASHGSGAGYGPCAYACYKGDLVECNADSDGNPCCPVYKSGLSQKYYLQCRKYWGLVREIREEAEIT